jgi:hypothetical protein
MDAWEFLALLARSSRQEFARAGGSVPSVGGEEANRDPQGNRSSQAGVCRHLQTTKLRRGCSDVAHDRAERRMVPDYCNFTMGSAFRATG